MWQQVKSTHLVTLPGYEWKKWVSFLQTRSHSDLFKYGTLSELPHFMQKGGTHPSPTAAKWPPRYNCAPPNSKCFRRLCMGLLIGKTECGASYIWVQISTEIHKVTLMKCQRHWPRARQLPVVGQQQLPCQSRHSIPSFGSSNYNYKYYAAHRQQKIVQGLHNILDVRVSIYLPYCFSQSFSLFAFMCTYSGFSLTMILPSLE